MNLADGCISAHSLLHGHALSFSDQPYFADLIRVVKRPARPLVIMAGAGISMAAGLPSWAELVSELERRIVPKSIAGAFDALNHDDIERRTDTVLYLTGDTNVNSVNLKYIREALYRDNYEPEPSTVAQAIAQLAAVYPTRVSILTTNFDKVLEGALEEVFDEAMSYSFNTWTDWFKLGDDKHRASVMHVHGLIFSEDRQSLGPLVLSESDFRQHGPLIQERLLSIFSGSDVLVVGASLTDPNIATPLAFSTDPGEHYVVTTPALTHDRVPGEQCAEVAVWQSRSLEKALNVKPILLKSYSQVAQLVSECALAAHSPARYRRPGRGVPAEESLHYGTRFRIGIEGAYSTLGASVRDGHLSDLQALSLSRRLNELTTKKDGPIYRLNQLRRRHAGYCANSEQLGVSVWLRDLPNRKGSVYGLRLMATSTHAHWNSWSSFRIDPIDAASESPAVVAAFTGRALFVELDKRPHPSRTWRGAWAQPMVVGYTSSDADVSGWPIDQLQLGAVTVLTNRSVSVPKGKSAASRLAGNDEVSALVVLSQDEMAYFLEALDNVVVALFD